MARGLGDQVDTNFTRGAPTKSGRAKCPKFGAIFDNFRIWSRISQKHIDMSKIWIALDQLHFIPCWTRKIIWWTLVHKPKSYRRVVDPPNWTFSGDYISAPRGAGPSKFYTSYKPHNCISSRTWGAGWPQVGFCPIFLVMFVFLCCKIFFGEWMIFNKALCLFVRLSVCLIINK